jgi:hypothetical protein
MEKCRNLLGDFGMDRFERERVDGLEDGLSIALGIVRSSRNVDGARAGIERALTLAREAKDRDNLARLKEMVNALPSVQSL